MVLQAFIVVGLLSTVLLIGYKQQRDTENMDRNIKLAARLYIADKKLKPSLTKNSSHDFMKLTFNNTNNSLLDFQNVCNKSLNNKKEYNDKNEKEYVKKKNYNSISEIKKKKYKIKIGKK